MKLAIVAALALTLISGAATGAGAQSDDGAAEAAAQAAAVADDPEATLANSDVYDAAAPGPFNPEQDNAAAVDAALVAARASGRHVMIVFGGSWCHDTDALISAFARPRAQAMLDARYEIVWIDVPYSQDEREFAVARRFGLGEIEGTPTVLIVRADGTAVNLDDAPRWRNAASRKPAAIVRHFERAVPAATTGR